ncbi:MAG: hypothetical protein HW390_1105 [Candidatus Brocadiaceae bacterium]|nr:hypothetical protein [Candidatus Brocadiaceae bacterium]
MITIPEQFKPYLSSLLRDTPVLPPNASKDDWDKLLIALKNQWVSPLLYWKITTRSSTSLLPHHVVEHLRNAFLWSRFRTMQMEKQLSVLLNAFQHAGIDILILKGPALARSVYPDPATRPSSDLDILIKPSQVERAGVLLQELGYLLETKRFMPFLKNIYKDEIFKPTGKTRNLRGIELHWDLYLLHGTTREVGVEDLFQRAVALKTPSLTMSILHPIDALMYSAINIRNHLPHNRLTWIYDTALLAGQLSNADDWKILQWRCVEWRGRNAMETALKLARDWAGTSIPFGFDDFSQWPAPASVELARHSRPDMGHVWLTGGVLIYVIRTLRFDFVSSIFSMVTGMFTLLFPSADYIRASYPPAHQWLLPLSYVRRWLNWGKMWLQR